MSCKRYRIPNLISLAFLLIPSQRSHDFATRWVKSLDVENGILLTIGQSDHSQKNHHQSYLHCWNRNRIVVVALIMKRGFYKQEKKREHSIKRTSFKTI